MAFSSIFSRKVLVGAGPPVACLVAACVLFACGSSDDQKPAAKADQLSPPGLLTDKQVRAAKPGSLQRAFLSWWQAVQYRDAVTAYALVTPSARGALTRADFSKEAAIASAGFAARPEVVGRTVSGGTTVLRTRLNFFSGGKKTAVVPLAFSLAKRGRWLINDLTYFRQQAVLGRERARQAAGATNPKASKKPLRKPSNTTTQSTAGAQSTSTTTSP